MWVALKPGLAGPDQNNLAQHVSAVRIDAGFPDTWPPKKINAIGPLMNGPAGHMNAFGQVGPLLSR